MVVITVLLHPIHLCGSLLGMQTKGEFVWSSPPQSPDLPGQSSLQNISVRPGHETVYPGSLLGGRHRAQLCLFLSVY
jgi:hypothetical protein